MKRNTKSRKGFYVSILCCIVIVPAVLFLYARLEGTSPKVVFDSPLRTIGISGDVLGEISDDGCGLRSLWIAVSDNKKESVLFEKKFDSPGFFAKGLVKNEKFEVKVRPREIGMKDGPAVLKIRVTDYSWRNWFKGNVKYIEKDIVFDTVPPVIDVLSTSHNITQGGSGLIIYKISEKNTKSGVYIGDKFYPGHSGHFSDPDVFMAFFAWGFDQSPRTPARIEAVDTAGNIARSGFSHYVKRKNYRRDVIRISDHFLDNKMPSFNPNNYDGEQSDNLSKFLFVNRTLREKNSQSILDTAENTENSLYWKGSFKRLPGSATRAKFADHRSYMYKGKKIDEQYHMGIDLASIKHADVPAANSGVIAKIEVIGIYGRTVIIDHGYGLFSSYSHLSRVEVSVGQHVKKGDIIAKTGSTGLAGGDHLHYGMFINKTFVNPLQWWDGTWIKNNITDKIDDVSGEIK